MIKQQDIAKFKEIINTDMNRLGLSSLHYVLFDETKRLPWAIHLFWKDGTFKVNMRDERSYVLSKTWEFDDFETAKTFFLQKNIDFVALNKRRVTRKEYSLYPSPLWDKTDD
ncbi:Imm59 family immunity protein [Streptococcus acidominimus]|uniref:Uncharacterized protein n=1 Tax=Streptococcus acidominimus TaxID=1326 RepID=A0A1Q8EC43_STRAI|nr:Imm59 family immunity protein [Streptococcus acidominimus]MBF0847595.1 hypothetical protein [Streptococcus danieliae]MBF0819800.1 hypothetical protein [Streptococcus acidominimus]MBF0839253.1 hypothetical protein [Streptococcus acidominimus]OLF49347.1 hypothetical protein BU200_07900 [Streptococcus acidominimus]TFU29427.1 hypothetical protein E4U01_10135 [Streptococcus acidominimus]